MTLIFPTTIFLGGWLLASYANRPGDTGTVPSRLSDVAGLPSDFEMEANSNSLFLFIHPKCTCSKATINNLGRLLDSMAVPPAVTVFAPSPLEDQKGWMSTELVKQARKKCGNVVADTRGKIASAFGVRTSGHILVYNQKQDLAFSGGVTQSRGHEGECQPLTDLAKQISNAADGTNYCPVFGCTLISSEEGSQ